uniref:Uncharacterized protein n=1 Tax=Moniliophthora roreri TaxID=221103 RepID=A0A0W0FR71_MONRR
MSIIDSSQVSIRGRSTFNHVRGDQINQTISGGVVNVYETVAKAVERSISDEFEYVKRGHIIGIKELYSDPLEWDWHWRNGDLFRRPRKSARKTVSTVNIHPNPQSKFTVFEYKGDDAHEAWEDDFQQFSLASRMGSFQLFGINRSGVPMLIFHHGVYREPPTVNDSNSGPVELIPVAHFFTGSLWMNVYLAYLSGLAGNGVLCDGPAGPNFLLRFSSLKDDVIQDIPSTLDMLEERSSLRFFSWLGSSMDRHLLQYVTWFSKITYFNNLAVSIMKGKHAEDNTHPDSTTDHPYLKDLRRNPSRHLPIDVNGGLRFDTVYSPLLEPVARWPEASRLWKWVGVDGLVEETWLDGGLTRFKLIDVGRVFLRTTFDWEAFCDGWLSQSSCAFDALETTERQESLFVVNPYWLGLRSTQHEYDTYDGPSASFDLCDAAEEISAVYLFLYPPPMTLSESASWMGGHTHFWSFDKTGHSRIPEVEWKRWDLPVLTPDTSIVCLRSWPTHVYTTLRDWQIARGFDPSTSDWARHVGCPELEIIGAEKKKSRFEELVQHEQGSGTIKPLSEVVQDPVNQSDTKAVKHQWDGIPGAQSEVLQEKSKLGWLGSVWVIVVDDWDAWFESFLFCPELLYPDIKSTSISPESSIAFHHRALVSLVVTNPAGFIKEFMVKIGCSFLVWLYAEETPCTRV